MVYRMDLSITTVVLISAMMHASWNAIVKGARDTLATQAAIVIGGGLYAVPFLFFVPFPNSETWIYLGLSSLIHCAYFAALAAAYDVGDLGFIYPIARGTAPVLVAVLSALTIGEFLTTAQLTGVLIICFGVLTLALTGQHSSGHNPFFFALGVSFTVASYSITDGAGVRVAETPFSYISWLIAIQALTFGLFVIWRRRWQVYHLIHEQGRTIWLGGLLIGASYGMAIWAFYAERVSVVMALRETAVVFAAIIGTIVFKEAFGQGRVLAAILIVTGAVWLNVAG